MLKRPVARLPGESSEVVAATLLPGESSEVVAAPSVDRTV